MAEKLPREVLRIISNNLSRNEICTCMCVCRSWNEALVSILYDNIKIENYLQFEQLTETLSNAKRHDRPGRFVRKVKLQCQVSVAGLRQWTQLCPYITEFDATWKVTPKFVEVLKEWKHLKVGPRLRLTSRPAFSLDSFKHSVKRLSLGIDTKSFSDWIKVLVELPSVEELKINSKTVYAYRAMLSIAELEKIHSSLPHLRKLTLADVHFHGELPKQITPCDTVRSLSLTPEEDELWGQYFAQKYTNLNDLEINGSFLRTHNGYRTNEVMTLARSCRYLRRLPVFTFDSDDLIYQQFVRILREIGAPLSNLEVSYIEYLPGYTSTIHSFQRTLAELAILFFEQHSLEEILEPLKSCIALTRLSIREDTRDMNIDEIFNACPRLESLTVYGNLLRLSNDNINRTQYPLKQLTLSGSLNNGVISFITQSCPNLSEFDCRGSERGGVLNMDFSSLTLNKLAIHALEAEFTLSFLGKTKQPSSRSNHNNSIHNLQLRMCPNRRCRALYRVEEKETEEEEEEDQGYRTTYNRLMYDECQCLVVTTDDSGEEYIDPDPERCAINILCQPTCDVRIVAGLRSNLSIFTGRRVGYREQRGPRKCKRSRRR